MLAMISLLQINLRRAGYTYHSFRRVWKSLTHIEGFSEGKADAALAASIFHFNKYSIKEVKEYLRNRGVSVRL